MSLNSRMAVKTGVACVLFTLTSCLQAHELEPDTSVSLKTAAVIGGFEADSPKLNAVGSISRLKKPVAVSIDENDAGVFEAEPTLTMSCSGALLNDRTVLTAKHCTGEFAAAARSDETLVFALGPDALHPTAYATVIDLEEAPGGTQGFARNGHDVAVLHLLEPLEGARVVKLGALDNTQLGQEFAGIGFGQSDNRDTGKNRRIGGLKLRALEGRTYELLLGSFEAFFLELRGFAVPPECVAPTPEAAATEVCKLVAADRVTFDSTTLEQAGEMLLSSEGGSQPCFGDSGGPLLRANEAGELVAYGVVSGGVSSAALRCDHGAVYARFTPEVMSFLEQSLLWQDPCRDLPAAGQCAGETARRCSTLAEGKRRVVEMNCATVGLRCNEDPDAGVSCQ
jgi:hypothetical protein